MIDAPERSKGFVFAATGEIYTIIARRAARSLRQVHPEAEIDLFTDAPLDDLVFSQVHQLTSSFFRPKMEALARSRFDRTVCLDADIMVVGDLDPVFEVLTQFDIAGCYDRNINADHAMRIHRRPLPAAFPVVNTGVLGVRKSPKVKAFLEHWQTAVKETNSDRDQPAFRELLFDSDLRLCTLPPTFNFMTFHELARWWGTFSAPRVLHSPFLHRTRIEDNDPNTPFTMEEVVGPVYAPKLRAIIHADRNLTPDVEMSTRVMYDYPVTNPVLIWARKHIRPIFNNIRYAGTSWRHRNR